MVDGSRPSTDLAADDPVDHEPSPAAQRTRVLVVYGTRPEAIKLAPVLDALRSRSERFTTIACSTGQHRDLIDRLAGDVHLNPDIDLSLMRPDQQLSDFAARALHALDEVLEAVTPDWVILQGDTTTATAGALGAFYRRIPVAHVEAGLRTGDLASPHPEEGNRRVVDSLASALFAPTNHAASNLRAEGLPNTRIFVTGNTVIDAVRAIAGRLEAVDREPLVLITAHRRESFGAALQNVYAAVADLARQFPKVRWIYPVHPNPNVTGPAHRALSGIANVDLREPLSYREMVQLLRRALFVMTDSGGLQEEAAALSTPLLVLRSETERIEGLAAGGARLVGTDRTRIVEAASELLTRPEAYAAMAVAPNPYGDGRAAERIVAVLAGEPWQPWTG